MAQSETAEARVRIADNAEALNLFGKYDQNLKIIEENFDVRIASRGDEVYIQGSPAEVAKVEALFLNLLEALRAGNYLSIQDLRYAIKLAREGARTSLKEVFSDVILITHATSEHLVREALDLIFQDGTIVSRAQVIRIERE